MAVGSREEFLIFIPFQTPPVFHFFTSEPGIWKALKANHYQGDITFETGSYSQNLPNSLYVSSLELLHALGELIKEKITD